MKKVVFNANHLYLFVLSNKDQIMQKTITN